jgi:hypothetical protein
MSTIQESWDKIKRGIRKGDYRLLLIRQVNQVRKVEADFYSPYYYHQLHDIGYKFQEYYRAASKSKTNKILELEDEISKLNKKLAKLKSAAFEGGDNIRFSDWEKVWKDLRPEIYKQFVLDSAAERCKICGKEIRKREPEPSGCWKCEGVPGVEIHSVWCDVSDYCEGKREVKQ